jgi:hypothetical protein
MFFGDDFQSTPTPISLPFSESTRTVSASKSTRHLWKMFRWWFSSRHRLCFHWLFLSQQGLAALLNPAVTIKRSFSDDFWVDNILVFVDYFWVNRGWGRWRIHASPLKDMLLTFF